MIAAEDGSQVPMQVDLAADVEAAFTIVGAVQTPSDEHLRHWWSGVFGIDETALWRSVSVHPHGLLGDYPGCFVAWRDEGQHVSAPATDVIDLAARPGAVDLNALRQSGRPAARHRRAGRAQVRGRGLAPVVARLAASYAIREHGLARCGARHTNVASLATARRLGFVRYCTQLTLRPA